MNHIPHQLLEGAIAIFAMSRITGDEPKEIWMYRTAVLVLLSILGTIFMADKFIPSAYKDDKPDLISRISVIEQNIEDIKESLRKHDAHAQ